MLSQVKDDDADAGAPWEGFPERKRIAAEKYAVGEPIKRIAEALKVNRTTVWRWLKDPDFNAYVKFLHDQRFHQTFDLIDEAFVSSLQTIRTSAEEGDAQVALSFVRAVLVFKKPPA
jgi:hypothetical protein